MPSRRAVVRGGSRSLGRLPGLIVDRGPPPAQAELGRGTPIVGERALLGIRVGRPPRLAHRLLREEHRNVSVEIRSLVDSLQTLGSSHGFQRAQSNQ